VSFPQKGRIDQLPDTFVLVVARSLTVHKWYSKFAFLNNLTKDSNEFRREYHRGKTPRSTCVFVSRREPGPTFTRTLIANF